LANDPAQKVHGRAMTAMATNTHIDRTIRIRAIVDDFDGEW
jgi:hypothetical protein